MEKEKGNNPVEDKINKNNMKILKIINLIKRIIRNYSVCKS